MADQMNVSENAAQSTERDNLTAEDLLTDLEPGDVLAVYHDDATLPEPLFIQYTDTEAFDHPAGRAVVYVFDSLNATATAEFAIETKDIEGAGDTPISLWYLERTRNPHAQADAHTTGEVLASVVAQWDSIEDCPHVEQD